MSSDIKTFYILGAGFSKACGFPLAEELGRTVIENRDCINAGEREFISSDNSIFEKLWAFYQQIKDTKPFEELWIELQQEIDALNELTRDQRTKWWLLRYFVFAIRYYFLKHSSGISALQQCYQTFFEKLRMESTYDRSDAVLYMNWDPLPEQYCGVCYSNIMIGKGRPFYYPVGASGATDKINIAPGIQVYRPAGGIHLFEMDDKHVLNDATRKCFAICDSPRVYLETSLDLTRRQQMKIQAGDDLELMLFPGANATNHLFTQGQLNVASQDVNLSDRLIIIGYRFPQYDNHMRKWFESHDFKGKEIVVVNPEDNEETFRYVKEVCKDGRVTLEKQKFEDSAFGKS